jgi:hypothetical protein
MTPEERLDRIETTIDKHNSAIGDLITVSRTVLTSVQELRDAQGTTEEKLNILIDTVDRIVRGRDAQQ